MAQRNLAEDDSLSDDALIALARDRDEAAVRTITRRHNRRLFRIARAILRDSAEAEDVVQETYVRAFTGLHGFRGESAFVTWITRIAMNDALGRLRKRRSTVDWSAEHEDRLRAHVIHFSPASASPDPESTMAQRQIQTILECAIDALPDGFRTVFVARIVEGMSVEETSDLLGLRPETVKTRLHRARLRLRGELDEQLGPLLRDTFPFDGARCERLTEAVLGRLRRPD